MEDKKKIGLIVTAVTVVLCGCPGLCLMVFGALTAADTDFARDLDLAPSVGFGVICLALLLIIVPIAAGVYTLLQRKDEKPEVIEDIGDIPPAI